MIKRVDALVIGAGPAGLGAALALRESGIQDILVVEREPSPGGILMQCIHNGFGLHRFKEELTGPEYAERYIKAAGEESITPLTNTAAIDIIDKGSAKTVVLLSEEIGLMEVDAKAVILAMGCRERNRGNISIPGSRPAGIVTAGLAQKMTNLHGLLPGKEIVILGSGDIGLIMARRLTWEGSHVKAVVEVQPYPGGLNRNIMQCLHDFHIPLYLSHTVTNIVGNERIEAVNIAPIDTHFDPQKKGSFTLTCDSLLLSVGLIPENELSLKAGVALDLVTGGASVNADLMTSIPGIFSCGNVLQVHDLVDFVSEEAEYCGKSAASYIKKGLKKVAEIPVKAGNLVRYVLPTRVKAGEGALLSLRAMAPAENVYLTIKTDKETLSRTKQRKIFPSIMLRIPVKKIPADAQHLEVLFELEAK
ncbi:NAD(P)/FAD-dependent oxidoreductase [Candidatus Omnitrophota bacterium]